MSYRPYVSKEQTSPAELKEKIIAGKKYQITLVTGELLAMKVSRILDDKLMGMVNQPRKNFRQENYMIRFDQIESVKNQKVSAGQTFIAIAVPVGVIIFFISNISFTFGGSTPIL